MTDGAIVNVTDYGTPYLSNSDLSQTVSDLVEQLEESVGGTVEQVQTNTQNITNLQNSSQTMSQQIQTISQGLGTQVTYALNGTTLTITTK